MPKLVKFTTLLLLLPVIAVSCGNNSPSSGDATGETPGSPDGSAASADRQTFQVRGVIRELDPDGMSARIRHEEIPDYMAAMTMKLSVKDPQELAGLAVGDPVSFRMIVTAEEGWIDQVKKLDAIPDSLAEAPPPRETFRIVRSVEPLNIGDPIPDYPFTNQLGDAFSLHDFRGKALAITFIFTRCPFPDFCPRMLGNFETASARLKAMPDAPDNWHLLALSFDPEYDTPERMKSYARQYEFDPEHWSFATGALIEIDALTEQFGLVFPRSDAGALFDHNLRTVVIDAQGKVQSILIGNQWKVEDLVAEMAKAARAEG
ncbi:MAG TPA: SCO family protein [Methylomirabilota bacterium]|nr:SCO family protein [Methylomirabilota bacterium]